MGQSPMPCPQVEQVAFPGLGDGAELLQRSQAKSRDHLGATFALKPQSLLLAQGTRPYLSIPTWPSKALPMFKGEFSC